jgi:hypothetical protein
LWRAKLLRRLAAVRHDERGVSLVLALIIVTALSITTAGLVTLISSNERAYGRDRQENRAFNTAEAGLNYAISVLANNVDSTGSQPINTWYPSSTTWASYPAGTGDGGWRAQKIQKTPYGIWQLYATGTSPTGKVIREVSVKVKSYAAPGTFVPASGAWAYGLFVGNPGSACFSPGGSATLTISIYVKGCIDLQGNTGIAEPSTSTTPSVKVYAETTLKISSGSAQIGASNKRVLSVIAPSGCTGKSGVICSAGNPQGSTSKVYASLYTGPSQNIPKPPVYPDAKYAMGDWANPVCSIGSFTFDTNTVRDTSAGTADLFPATSYDCYVWNPAHTAYVGHLKWNASAGTLVGSGLIYVDGNLQMNNNVAASYTTPALTTGGALGLALYVNGAVTMNGTASLCGPPAVASGGTCSGKWVATQGAITVVAVNALGLANPFAVGWKANGNAYYDISAYVVGQYWTNGSSGITGPVVTDTASVTGSGSQTDVSDPPPDAPGASYTDPGSTDWGVIPATWQQLKAS